LDTQRDALEAYFNGGDERRLMQVIKVVEPELVEVATIEGSEKD